MSLEDKFQISKVTDFGKWLNEYAKYGMETHRIMCEWELKEIRRNYGERIYEELYQTYNEVKSIWKN